MRFANVRGRLGIEPDDRLFILLGQVPELHVAALAEAANGEPDQLIESAARAGYDLHGMRPFLEEIRQRGGS
jgi:acyl-coenzyme A synthetase/AMP-(fatty) acid ligase